MLAGGLDLPKLLPFLGKTQFKVLCAVASFVMFATVAINCASVSERDPTLDGPPEGKEGLLNVFKGLYRAVVRLPPQITRVCAVQFVAWIGYDFQPPKMKILEVWINKNPVGSLSSSTSPPTSAKSMSNQSSKPTQTLQRMRSKKCGNAARAVGHSPS
jgi:hypothetical protein